MCNFGAQRESPWKHGRFLHPILPYRTTSIYARRVTETPRRHDYFGIERRARTIPVWFSIRFVLCGHDWSELPAPHAYQCQLPCHARLLAVDRSEYSVCRATAEDMGMDEGCGGSIVDHCQAPGLKSVPAGSSEDPSGRNLCAVRPLDSHLRGNERTA